MTSKAPHIDVDVRHEHYREDFLAVLKEIRPQWQAQDVIFEGIDKDMSHGRVNTMIRCYRVGQPQDSIMIRIHNTKMSQFFNHSVEAELVQHFYSLGCGPKVLATFQTGFCYEFIHGEILSSPRLLEEPIWRQIAKEQAKMHCATFESPPHFIKDGGSFLAKAYAMMEAYPDQLKDPVQNERMKTDLPSKDALKKEFHECMEHALSFDPDVVLGHNDPRAENIIWNAETGVAKFVDFEACGYIYRPLTLCLHLCRFGGEPTNYNELPSEDLQKNWLQVYLENYFALTGRKRGDVTARDVERLYVQVTKFKPIVLFLSAIGMLVCDQTDALDNRLLDPVGICIDAVKHHYQDKERIRSLKMPD